MNVASAIDRSFRIASSPVDGLVSLSLSTRRCTTRSEYVAVGSVMVGRCKGAVRTRRSQANPRRHQLRRLRESRGRISGLSRRRGLSGDEGAQRPVVAATDAARWEQDHPRDAHAALMA